MRESSASAPSCPVLSINRDLDPAATAEVISRDRRVWRHKQTGSKAGKIFICHWLTYSQMKGCTVDWFSSFQQGWPLGASLVQPELWQTGAWTKMWGWRTVYQDGGRKVLRETSRLVSNSLFFESKGTGWWAVSSTCGSDHSRRVKFCCSDWPPRRPGVSCLS